MRKTKKVRVGIIGIGKMGAQHAHNLYQFAGRADLVAIQDIDFERARYFANNHNHPKVFKNADDLINSKDVDAVLIAAPDELHANLLISCINAGKPVFCEKPLATNIEDAKKIINAEIVGSKRLISMGFQRRFDPSHKALKETIISGQIGKPLLWKGVHRNAKVPYDSSGRFILMNSAGHDIDSARWLLNEEVLEVSVKGLCSRPEFSKETRDLLLVQMEMTNGCFAIGELFMSADYGYEVSAEVVGQYGIVTTMQPGKLYLRAKSWCSRPVSPDWTEPFQEAYLLEINNWIESIYSERPFEGASAWDGYIAIIVSEAASVALAENKSCKIELMQKPIFY